jgi:hypothetical protein
LRILKRRIYQNGFYKRILEKRKEQWRKASKKRYEKVKEEKKERQEGVSEEELERRLVEKFKREGWD